MGGKRTYGDICGTARALDVVGERWALMVVRELVLGPKRFTDLRAGLPHVSPDMLTLRLKELAGAGLVSKRKLPPPAASQVYELTELGRELEPVLEALGRFGARLPIPDCCSGMSFNAHVLSFRTLFRPDLADGLELTLELRLDEGEPFHALVHQGALDLDRGAPEAPQVVVEAEIGALLATAHGRASLDGAMGDGTVRVVAGDPSVLQAFCGLFPLPDPADVPVEALAPAGR